MKFYGIHNTLVSPEIRDALTLHEEGRYFVYGVSVGMDNTVAVTCLHTGSFFDIGLSLPDQAPHDFSYLVPVPEYLVDIDSTYSTYVQLHFLRQVDIGEMSDAQLRQQFVENFQRKLEEIGQQVEELVAAGEDGNA